MTPRDRFMKRKLGVKGPFDITYTMTAENGNTKCGTCKINGNLSNFYALDIRYGIFSYAPSIQTVLNDP